MQVPTEGKRKRNANNSLFPHMHCNIIIDHYIMKNSGADKHEEESASCETIRVC